MSADSFISVVHSHSISVLDALLLYRLVFIAVPFCLLDVLGMLVRNHSLAYPAVKVYLCLPSCKKEFQEKHINDINNSYRF